MSSYNPRTAGVTRTTRLTRTAGRTRCTVLVGIMSMLVATSILLAGPASGAATPTADARAAGWLALQFTAGTRLQTPFSGTYFDDYGLTADGILALDSAGVGQSLASTATSWLAANVNAYVGDGGAESYAGPLAKTMLITQAQGLSSTSFGGRNLVTALAAREQTNGTFAGRFSDHSAFGDFSNAITQSLAIIVERRAGGAGPSAAALSSLISLQCADHGFRQAYPTNPNGPCISDTDATAYAIQALSGTNDTSAATQALGYLATKQGKDGGVVSPASGIENSNTTGLAAVAFAVGGRPEAAQALNYLKARQAESTALTAIGAVNFTAGVFDPTTAIRSTTQAIPGLVAGANGDPSAAGLLTVHAHGIAGTSTRAGATGSYRPVSPTRLLDTRTGTAVGAGKSVSVQITGRAGISATISAVVLTVTAVTPAGAGNVTAFASGTARPGTSDLNFVAGRTIANSVVVGVGGNGKVDLYNSSARPLNLVVDAAGYYLPGTGLAAGSFRALTPARILDTRTGTAVPARGQVTVQVTTRGGVPATDVSAAALNVTAVNARSLGNVTVFAAGGAIPGVSNLNFVAGQTVANSALVRIGSGGRITLFNSSATPLNLVVDVSGYFVGGTPRYSGTYVALAPSRLLDTRTGAAVPAMNQISVLISGRAGVPAAGAVSAAAYNMTAVNPTAAGNVIAYQSGAARPNTSNLNMNPGITIAATALTKLGSDGRIDLFNNSRRPLNLIVDIAGYFRS